MNETDTIHTTEARRANVDSNPVMAAIEQAFGGPVPTCDAPNVTYGSYGTWEGTDVLDQTNAQVCEAVANVRSMFASASRRAFAQAANIRSPRDLDAIVRAGSNGRSARWVVAR
jgi:hypothetical protein